MPWDKPESWAPKGTGATLGRVAGGVIGAGMGGGLGAAVGQNWGRMIGSGMPGINAMAKGNVFGKTKGGPGGPQDQSGPRPQLSPWVGMNWPEGEGVAPPNWNQIQSNIRATDLYRPTTVTGSEIQKQMEESPWYKMALQKQGLEEANLMNQAAAQQAGALAGSRSQLAMRGGLRGGSAERLAMSGAENLASTMQKQRMAGALERSNLGMQSADLASKLAQANAQALTEAQARNIGAGVGELDKKRAYELAKYQEQMKGYAAEKTGQALGKEPKPTLFGDPIGYFGSMFNK